MPNLLSTYGIESLTNLQDQNSSSKCKLPMLKVRDQEAFLWKYDNKNGSIVRSQRMHERPSAWDPQYESSSVHYI